MALSRSRHCGRKASLGGLGDYTQADSQWENSQYKVTIGCLKLWRWVELQGPAAATVYFQCIFTTRKEIPSLSSSRPLHSFLPPTAPICLPGCEYSVQFSYLVPHTTGTFPVWPIKSYFLSKRQHASTCPPLSCPPEGQAPGRPLTFSLFIISPPPLSVQVRPRSMACGRCSETPVGCTSGSGRGGSHLGDMVTSPSYLKPVRAEEFPQPAPKVQGRPGCGDRASLSICTHGTAFALARCGGWLLLILFVLPLLVVDVPCVVVVPSHCEVLQEPAHPLGGSHLGSASDGLEGWGRTCT